MVVLPPRPPPLRMKIMAASATIPPRISPSMPVPFFIGSELRGRSWSFGAAAKAFGQRRVCAAVPRLMRNTGVQALRRRCGRHGDRGAAECRAGTDPGCRRDPEKVVLPRMPRYDGEKAATYRGG